MYKEYGGVKRITRAADAALLVTKVLNNLDIKSKVVGFTSTTGSKGYDDTAYHVTYKDWAEGGSLDVLSRLMTMNAHQYNLDGYFLQEAYRELRTRREAKRILIVLSDGQPYLDRDNQVELMRKNINKMGKEGIEVIGVGVADDSVVEYYKTSIVVWDEAELGQKLVKVLHDALLK
jgi:cobaltochelatase CobT